MGGASRRGSVTAGPGPARPHKRWSFRDGVSPFAGSPAVWADRVFVGSDNRCLYCLDANDGRRIWRFKAAAELFAAPAIAEDRVWIGEGLHETTRGKIYCLRARDGAAVWEFETRSHVEFGVSLLGGRLYAAAGQDGVYCLDAATGGKIWQHGGLHVDMSVLAVRDGVFLGTAYGSPCFLCLEAESGALRWRTPSPMAVRSSPSTDGARVCFGVGNGTFSMGHASPTGAVVCLDIGTGALLWTTDFVADAVLTTVALADGRAFFGSRDGGVYGVDARTGRRIWRFETGSPVLSSAAAAGGRIYAASEAGVVFCLDAGTGRELWRYDSSQLAFSDGRVVGSPAIANGRLYLGSMNSLFFCLGE
jgi:outer membrane protein assembly factor BamB